MWPCREWEGLANAAQEGFAELEAEAFTWCLI